MTIAKYTLFAMLSTAVNLIVQWISFLVYQGDFALYAAMAVGTLSGLILKYILDKNFVFYHKAKTRKDDGKKFLQYSIVGVFTTPIFWGVEMSFDALFDHPSATYIGAFIGLSIGYAIKYHCDKKIVFTQ